MAYPRQSNFRSSAPFSAWWYLRLPDEPELQIGQESGAAFLAKLQAWLRERIRRTAAGSVQGWGETITPEQVPQGGAGGWSRPVLQAMYGVAQLDAHAYQIVGLERTLYFDIRDSRVSRDTVRAAIWMLKYSSAGGTQLRGGGGNSAYNQGSPLQVVLPFDVVLPRFGEAMPLTGGDAKLTYTGAPEFDVSITTPAVLMDRYRSPLVTHPAVLAGEAALILIGSLLLGEQTAQLEGEPKRAGSGARSGSSASRRAARPRRRGASSGPRRAKTTPARGRSGRAGARRRA